MCLEITEALLSPPPAVDTRRVELASGVVNDDDKFGFLARFGGN
jgi:hypothetical protein